MFRSLFCLGLFLYIDVFCCFDILSCSLISMTLFNVCVWSMQPVENPQNISIVDSSVTVLSVNCQGLRIMDKRIDVLHYLDNLKANIICLQDTHWLD